MSGLMARAAGPGGEVLAFEPHPGIRSQLEGHVREWGGAPVELAKIRISPLALSDRPHQAKMEIPEDFERNRGSAHIASADGDESPAASASIPIEAARLDDLVGDETFGVLKIDVEGHEKSRAGWRGWLARASRRARHSL